MDLDRGFRIGEWTVLPRQSELVRASETIHIEPRVMGVLVCLAKHAPETAKRDEIFGDVWSGLVVQDEALSRNISILRSHLDGEQKYIQTIPRVGYRLLVDVEPLRDASSAPESDDELPVLSQPPKGLLTFLRTKPRLVGAASIAIVAVAGFFWQHLGTGDNYDFTAAELNNPVPPKDLAGAIRNTRLSAQLLMLGYTNVQRLGAENLRSSVRLFKDALKQDNSLAEAHLGLAQAYSMLPSYDGSDQDLMDAKALAELDAAVAKGADVRRTYEIKADIDLYNMNWIDSRENYLKAIAFNPRQVIVRIGYAELLAKVGFVSDSIDQCKAALGINRQSPIALQRLGISYVMAGKDALANAQFEAARRAGIAPYANPEPRIILLLRERRIEDAGALIRSIQVSQGLKPGWVQSFLTAMSNPAPDSITKALTTRRQAWLDGQMPDAFYLGMPLMLGDAGGTISAANELMVRNKLSRLLEAMFLPEAKAARNDPAFITLIVETGLAGFWGKYGLPDVCRGEHPEAFCARIPQADPSPVQ